MAENSVIVEEAQGTVQTFDDEKGYGFIKSPQADRDVFVHHKNILMPGRRTLHPEDKVKFRLTRGPKGWNAEDVELC